MVADADWEQLLNSDQSDRTAGLSDEQLIQRDAERIQWVRIHTPATSYARYVAALIYHHHGTREEMDVAYAWATAVMDDVSGARALVAMIDDRRCLMDNQLQRYGTQYRRTDGKWHLAPYNTATTDAERSAMRIRPLAALLDDVSRLNSQS